MMNSIYIGIDGGGSKTKLRMVDKNHRILAETIAGPSNIYLSVDIAHDSILTAFHLALKKAGIQTSNLNKYSFHAGMGLAGCEVKSARNEFLKKKFPFDTVTLQSDAYTACLGAHAGKNGSIVIAGTGVVGLKICDKKKNQVGGWGFPHGDAGGGAWLGLEAVKSLLLLVDGGQTLSPFFQELQKKCGRNRENLSQWACNASATQYAQLTPIIVKYAKKKDAFANNLLKEAAKHIEAVLKILLENNSKNLPCAFLGGMAPILLPYLKKSTQKKLSHPEFDACQGALFLIMK